MTWRRKCIPFKKSHLFSFNYELKIISCGKKAQGSDFSSGSAYVIRNLVRAVAFPTSPDIKGIGKVKIQFELSSSHQLHQYATYFP